MNFLAHTLFAEGDAERIAGQFCGDFVRGSDLSMYTPGIVEGIRRHRRLDAFTDSHPAVKLVHGLFKPPLRRFAGVITDVYYDYALANSWDQYSDQSIEAHVDNVHAALNAQRDKLPADLQRFITFLQREQVLLANREYSGVELTLWRLSKRSPRFTVLADGAAFAAGIEQELAQSFHLFFPDALAEERQNCE